MNRAPANDFWFDEFRYRPVLAAWHRSAILATIWSEAYGADYPAEAEPFGFVTSSDLRRIAEELHVGPGALLGDFGCGRGGPGLWVARETGASLVGFDIVSEAVEQATARCGAFGLDQARARFHVGSVTESKLATSALAAAMSVDVLWMVLDKLAALDEAARVLRPGGRFVLTTWEPPYLRHTELLEDAGFDVVLSEETPDWEARQKAVYAGILQHADRLVTELGEAAATTLFQEARHVSTIKAKAPRVIIVAVKR